MAEPTEQQLMALAASFSRLMMAQALGQTAYEGQRDYYETLGYPPTIKFENYLQRYERQDIAGRIVDLPAQDTWRKPPTVTDSDDENAPFSQAWNALQERLRVWAYMSRVDKLSGIGHYGALLLGIRGSDKLATPAKEGSLKGERDILYLRPFGEGSAEIKTWEEDTSNERYGLPVMYALKLRPDHADQKVHWTRVIHVAEGKLDSETFGTPRLQRVYNRLDDLIKVVGGSAEATWLGMRPGTIFSAKEGYKGPESSDELEDLRETVRKYAHDILRTMFIEGYEPTQVGPAEVVNPGALFEVIVGCIAAASGIPQRVLLGSAQGQMAAAEWDYKQWAGEIAYRQSSYAEPEMLRPFVDRLIWLGALPTPVDGYDVGNVDEDGQRRWPMLVEMTAAEMATIQQQRASAIAQLSNPALAYPISDGERREVLGFSPEPEGEEVEQPPEESEEGKPPGVESPEEGAEKSEEGTPAAVVAQAVENYRAGAIDADQLATFAVEELAEVGRSGT